MAMRLDAPEHPSAQYADNIPRRRLGNTARVYF
jgi:hypothetical protein